MIEMSEQINELAAALAKAQATFTAVPKNKTAKVGTYGYKYADLADAFDVCRKPLADNGLSVVQAPAQVERGVCSVTTMLLHVSGQWMRSTLALDARDATPQSIGSVITYARRYGLGAMVGLVTDDDTDAQEHKPAQRPQDARHEPQAAPQPRQAAPAPQQANGGTVRGTAANVKTRYTKDGVLVVEFTLDRQPFTYFKAPEEFAGLTDGDALTIKPGKPTKDGASLYVNEIVAWEAPPEDVPANL